MKYIKANDDTALTAIIGEPSFKMEVAAAFAISEYRETVRIASGGTKSGKVIFLCSQ